MTEVRTPPAPSVYHADPGSTILVPFSLLAAVNPPAGRAYYDPVATERFSCQVRDIDRLRHELRPWALGMLTPKVHALGLYIAEFCKIEADPDDGEPIEGPCFREDPVCWDGETEIPPTGHDILSVA